MPSQKNLPHNQERRRAEAVTRQADYDTLSPAEKLAKLDAGGFRAARQRAKLDRLVGQPPAATVRQQVHDEMLADARPRSEKPRRQEREKKRGS